MSDIDFTGIMRAQVVKNDDPNGILGVFIPRLMYSADHKPNSDESKNKFKRTANSGIFSDDSPFKSSPANVPVKNYKLARPSFLNNNGKGTARPSGRRKIPKVGTWIFVFFEDSDPQKCIWLPYSPSVASNDIDASGLPDEFSSSMGSGATSNKVDIIESYDDGTIIAYDENGGVGSFIIKHGSGHTIRVRNGGGVSGVDIVTAGGQKITVDDIAKKITAHANKEFDITDDNGNSIKMNPSGIAIKDKNGSKIIMNGGGITIKGNPTTKIN